MTLAPDPDLAVRAGRVIDAVGIWIAALAEEEECYRLSCSPSGVEGDRWDAAKTAVDVAVAEVRVAYAAMTLPAGDPGAEGTDAQ